jgi:predicted nuclease with TOPRIM domain
MMLTIVPQQRLHTPQPAITIAPCPSLPAIETVSGTLTAELQAMQLLDLDESFMSADHANTGHNGFSTYEDILDRLRSSLKGLDTTRNNHQHTSTPSRCLAQWEQSRSLFPREIIGVDLHMLITSTSRQVINTQTLALVHTSTASSLEPVNHNSNFIGPLPLPLLANEASSQEALGTALPRLPALGALRLASDLTYHALLPVRAHGMALITSDDANVSKPLVFPGINASEPKYLPTSIAPCKRGIDQVDKPTVKLDRKRRILEHTKSKVRRNVYHQPNPAVVVEAQWLPEKFHKFRFTEPYDLVWTDWLVYIPAHLQIEFDSPIPKYFFDRMVRHFDDMSEAKLGSCFPIPSEEFLSCGETDGAAEEEFGQQMPDPYPHPYRPQVYGGQSGSAYPAAAASDDHEPFAYSAGNAYGPPPAAVVAGLNDGYGAPPAAVVAGIDVNVPDVGCANHPSVHQPFGTQPTTGYNDFDPAASPDEYGTSPDDTPSPPDTFDTAGTSPLEAWEAQGIIRNLVDELIQKEQELNEVKADNQAFMVQVHGMITNLRDHNNRLEDRCQALFAENRDLEKGNQSLSDINTALRQNNTRLELKTSSQGYNAVAMTELRRQKDTEIRSLGQDIRKLEQENKDLETKLDEAQEEKCDAWTEASKMEDERDEKAGRVEELEKELDEAKGKLCDAWTETSNIEEGRDIERAMKEKALSHIEQTNRKLSGM